MVARPAKLVARHAIDALSGKPSTNFRNETRHDHRVDIGGRQQEAMDHVRTRQTEFHRRIGGDLRAIWSESVLPGDQPGRERTVRLLRGAEITFGKLAVEMQRSGIDGL